MNRYKLEVISMLVELLLAYEEKKRRMMDLLESDLDDDSMETMAFMFGAIDKLVEEPISKKRAFLSEYIPLIEEHKYREIMGLLYKEMYGNLGEDK